MELGGSEMNNWTCPRCELEMYSAWDRREEKVITCIYCGMIFENQYYRAGGAKKLNVVSLAEYREKRKTARRRPRVKPTRNRNSNRISNRNRR